MAKAVSLKDRLKKKRDELATRGGGDSNVLYVKEGSVRVRILPIEKEELAAEVTHFYLNEKLKGIYSAVTVGEPCPAQEAYNELKKSKDPEDQELAKKLVPKKAYLIPVLVYADEKGKEIDKDKSGKLMKIANGVYQSIIDLYLDEDEWGDMTDPKKGYDIKIKRTGKGKLDTEYSVSACKNTPLAKEYAKKKIDLDGMVRSLIEPYDVVQEKIDEFLNLDADDDDDDKPKKKKKKDSKDDFKAKKSVKTKSTKSKEEPAKKKLVKKPLKSKPKTRR